MTNGLEFGALDMSLHKRRTWILIANLIGIVLIPAVTWVQTLKPDRTQSTIAFDPRIAEVTRGSTGVPTCGGRNAEIAPDTRIAVLAPYTLSQTHQRHPSLFWYYGLNVRCSAELIISEKEGSTVLSPRQLPPPDFGINRIDLADSRYDMNVNLEPDIIYQWSVRVRFDFETRPSAYPIAYGFIKRGIPTSDVTKQIEQQPDHQKPHLYAKYDFWYDALSIVSHLREVQPHNIQLKKFHTSLLVQERLPEYVISVVQ